MQDFVPSIRDRHRYPLNFTKKRLAFIAFRGVVIGLLIVAMMIALGAMALVGLQFVLSL